MKTIFKILIITFMIVNTSQSQVLEQWVQRFTSDSIKDESVNDIFVDSQGSIYITGSQRYSLSVPNEIEAVTVKYNSQGVQQWIQNYHAANNNGAFGRAIYVDAAGNVYIAGESAIFSGGGNRALIIKYSPDGTQQWANIFALGTAYNGGFDIVADLTGNVYVTGEYATNVITYNNIFLVKFGPTGNLINQTFYHSNSEGARKIGLDGAGKIIIGGYINTNDSLSLIALKYEQNLDFVWQARVGQNIGNTNVIDMAIDNNSNIILTGTGNSTIDYTTVKINPTGNVEWRKIYNSTSGWDNCKGVVTDNSGNIYITGTTGVQGAPLTQKITTIRYSPSGNEDWVANLDGNGQTDYVANDIAIDVNSNLYVTGTSSNNILTAKYNSSGQFQWSIHYNGTGNSIDNGFVVGADHNGNAYSAGNSIGSNSGYDIAIIKYVSSVGIQNISNEAPTGFSLSQNYPNPFNPVTNIEFGILKSGFVSLKIYDLSGKEVSSLVNEKLNSGSYKYNFDGSGFSSGTYLYKLQTGDFVETKKMLLIK